MIRYAVWSPSSREGEFEFLCSTQNNWTPSLRAAKKEAEEMVEDMMTSYDPPLSRKEALEELGGEPLVFKLTVEKV